MFLFSPCLELGYHCNCRVSMFLLCNVLGLVQECVWSAGRSTLPSAPLSLACCLKCSGLALAVHLLHSDPLHSSWTSPNALCVLDSQPVTHSTPMVPLFSFCPLCLHMFPLTCCRCPMWLKGVTPLGCTFPEVGSWCWRGMNCVDGGLAVMCSRTQLVACGRGKQWYDGVKTDVCHFSLPSFSSHLALGRCHWTRCIELCMWDRCISGFEKAGAESLWCSLYYLNY